MIYEDLLFEKFKHFLCEHQAVQLKKVENELGIPEGQVFERLMAWYANGWIEYRIVDDLVITKEFLLQNNITYKGKTIYYDEIEDIVIFEEDIDENLDTLDEKSEISKGIGRFMGNQNKSNATPTAWNQPPDHFDAEMNEIQYANSFVEETKKPVSVPKITSVDQIYWVCENCGQNNAYFLPKCKDCFHERPDSIYEPPDKEISIIKNGKATNFFLSEIVTDYWQAFEVIAGKLGVKNPQETKLLRLKLKFLERTNQIKPNKDSTMFKIIPSA